MPETVPARPKPGRTREAKLAVLELPEIRELLDSFWDGSMVIVIEKVKGRPTTIDVQIREDDLVTELLQPS